MLQTVFVIIFVQYKFYQLTEFLCDCQLDLEHASVLRQLSSCNKDRSSELVMQFHINIAFWKLLRKRSSQIAELVQTQFTHHRQTFDVRLFEGKQKRLDQPTDFEVFMERIDKNGKRIPTRNETENHQSPYYLGGLTIF